MQVGWACYTPVATLKWRLGGGQVPSGTLRQEASDQHGCRFGMTGVVAWLCERVEHLGQVPLSTNATATHGIENMQTANLLSIHCCCKHSQITRLCTFCSIERLSCKCWCARLFWQSGGASLAGCRLVTGSVTMLNLQQVAWLDWALPPSNEQPLSTFCAPIALVRSCNRVAP